MDQQAIGFRLLVVVDYLVRTVKGSAVEITFVIHVPSHVFATMLYQTKVTSGSTMGLNFYRRGPMLHFVRVFRNEVFVTKPA